MANKISINTCLRFKNKRVTVDPFLRYQERLWPSNRSGQFSEGSFHRLISIEKRSLIFENVIDKKRVAGRINERSTVPI